MWGGIYFRQREHESAKMCNVYKQSNATRVRIQTMEDQKIDWGV